MSGQVSPAGEVLPTQKTGRFWGKVAPDMMVSQRLFTQEHTGAVDTLIPPTKVPRPLMSSEVPPGREPLLADVADVLPGLILVICKAKKTRI